jgi:tetratricopeptide (TPR) repeat protein
VTGGGAFAIRADAVIRRALDRDPDRCLLRRQLAAALLAQHRFAEAIQEADRCRAVQPRQTWPLGVIADAALELADYPRAIDAVDAMLERRPDAGGYARAAYLRRLQGNGDEASRLLRMAIEATDPADAEALAWLHAELGIVLGEYGRTREARRELERARYIFAGHPAATRELARLLAARGHLVEAQALIEEVLRAAPTPADHALASRLLARTGQRGEADRHARLAEAGWRSDAPDPVQLTHFLLERGQVREAVDVATAAAASRQDIFTLDALGWAYFHAGRLADAADVQARIAATGLRPRAVGARARAVTEALAQPSGRR